ncbi:MAG: alkaline phosphatase family protein [Phycisphaerales bacterium]|nr:MAG: alkaline phosphatase family protein [Phycisphaerales bacterium]
MHRPDASVVLITVDGLNIATVDAMLAESALPNVQWMIDNGVRVRQAVSGYPTITYAQFTSIMTGLFAGHHGILGNKWFDRYSLTFRDYNTIATYRSVNQDFLAPTLYERLHEQMTVNIQSAIHRGVTRTIDNWMSGGVWWFFGKFQELDSIMPTRFEVISDLANETGRWPVLIHAYHPAVDEIGHRRGPDSPQYRRAVRNADRQIGRIRQAVASAGMTDRTCFVLLSDHGFEPVPWENCFDLARWLRREHGLKVTNSAYDSELLEDRHRHFNQYDAVVIAGGNRRAVIHLRGPAGWFDLPTRDQVDRLLHSDSQGGRASLVEQTGIQLAARRIEAPADSSVVELVSRHGVSRVTRRGEGDDKRYRYDVVDTDALGDWADDTLQAFIADGWHDSAQWLAATIDSPYPDLVVQIAEMFDSARAGDIALFSPDGWDFASHDRGGHGGVTRSDMLVPMIFVGPRLPKGRTIPVARLVDVAPTILHLIRGDEAQNPEPAFDGIDLTPQLIEAQ